MPEDLPIKQDITRDLLDRITSPSRKVREGAVEALAVSTEDEDWRPNELIRQGGIDIITPLLHEKNAHIVMSALDIIIATAAVGEEEALLEGGVIDVLDQIQDHKDPRIRKKVQEALWLLVPKVEDVVTSKPQDDY
jgi:oligoendopeptidase F